MHQQSIDAKGAFAIAGHVRAREGTQPPGETGKAIEASMMRLNRPSDMHEAHKITILRKRAPHETAVRDACRSSLHAIKLKFLVR